MKPMQQKKNKSPKFIEPVQTESITLYNITLNSMVTVLYSTATWHHHSCRLHHHRRQQLQQQPQR
jgi:hypothetical protein